MTSELSACDPNIYQPFKQTKDRNHRRLTSEWRLKAWVYLQNGSVVSPGLFTAQNRLEFVHDSLNLDDQRGPWFRLGTSSVFECRNVAALPLSPLVLRLPFSVAPCVSSPAQVEPLPLSSLNQVEETEVSLWPQFTLSNWRHISYLFLWTQWWINNCCGFKSLILILRFETATLLKFPKVNSEEKKYLASLRGFGLSECVWVCVSVCGWVGEQVELILSGSTRCWTFVFSHGPQRTRTHTHTHTPGLTGPTD